MYYIGSDSASSNLENGKCTTEMMKETEGPQEIHNAEAIPLLARSLCFRRCKHDDAWCVPLGDVVPEPHI